MSESVALSSPWRSVSYGTSPEGILKCDDSRSLRGAHRVLTKTSWYRFAGLAGNRIATSSPGGRRCGTDRTGWLATPHPTMGSPAAEGTACFSSSANACVLSINISVCACQDAKSRKALYAYRLPAVPWCFAGYCGERAEASQHPTSNIEVLTVVCIAGHLRSTAALRDALGSLQRVGLAATKTGSVAAVLATWDVWGMQSPQSKVSGCYDTRPLSALWRCPSAVSACEVVPFGDPLRLRLEARPIGRLAPMWYLIGRSFKLALTRFPAARRFLRTRPDVELVEPPAVEAMEASVVMLEHMYWKAKAIENTCWSACTSAVPPRQPSTPLPVCLALRNLRCRIGLPNDMIFLTDRAAAGAIAEFAPGWMRDYRPLAPAEVPTQPGSNIGAQYVRRNRAVHDQRPLTWDRDQDAENVTAETAFKAGLPMAEYALAQFCDELNLTYTTRGDTRQQWKLTYWAYRLDYRANFTACRVAEQA